MRYNVQASSFKVNELRRFLRVFVLIKSDNLMKFRVLRCRSNGRSFIASFYLICCYFYMRFMAHFTRLAVDYNGAQGMACLLFYIAIKLNPSN